MTFEQLRDLAEAASPGPDWTQAAKAALLEAAEDLERARADRLEPTEVALIFGG